VSGVRRCPAVRFEDAAEEELVLDKIPEKLKAGPFGQMVCFPCGRVHLGPCPFDLLNAKMNCLEVLIRTATMPASASRELMEEFVKVATRFMGVVEGEYPPTKEEWTLAENLLAQMRAMVK